MSDLEISYLLLKGVVDSVESHYRIDGGFNRYIVEYAGNACKLFGFTEEAQRFETLLSTLTPETFWAGSITNMDTSNMPSDATKLSPITKIEEELPLFQANYADTTLRELNGSLALCADREYDRAFGQADTELDRHEIVLAQVLMGDYEIANDNITRLNEKHRKDNVIFVIVTELYRQRRTSEAESYRRRLPPNYLIDYGGAHMAVGAANRVPWQIYPFPDY